MTIYTVGDGVELRHEVRDPDGNLTAATVALTVVKPSGATLTPSIDNSSLGVYDAIALADEPGLYTYAWAVSGAITDVVLGSFTASTNRPDMLADPADLSAYLQQAVDPSTASLLLQCATAVVQSIARQRLVRVVNDVAEFDLDEHDGSRYLYLPERPVTAVSAVIVGVTPLAPTDYAAQLRRGRLWRATGWRSYLLAYANQPSSVSVTYTHGYAADDQRIQLARTAALTLAATAVTNPDGTTQERIDDYTVTYDVMTAQMAATPFLTAAIRRTYGISVGSTSLTLPNGVWSGAGARL